MRVKEVETVCPKYLRDFRATTGGAPPPPLTWLRSHPERPAPRDRAPDDTADVGDQLRLPTLRSDPDGLSDPGLPTPVAAAAFADDEG
jgi:hypothetical protein